MQRSRIDLSRTKHASMTTQELLVKGMILCLFFSGFLNLVPTPFSLATLLIDASILIMLLQIGTRISSIRIAGEWWVLQLGIVLLFAAVLLLNGNESLFLKLNTLRQLLFYAVPAVYIALLIDCKDVLNKLLHFVMNCGLTLAVFGCIQFLGRGHVPKWLLVPRDADLFGYYGTEIIRANGLVGNTIVYSTLVLLVFLLWFASALRADITRLQRLTYLTAAAVALAAVLASLSRVAISVAFLAILILLVSRLFQLPVKSRLVVSLMSVWIIVTAGIVAFASEVLEKYIARSFLVQDVFFQLNPSVRGSTELHQLFTSTAREVFDSNPLLGIGLGSQSQFSENAQAERVITDGFHLQHLAEGGLVLLIPLVFLYLNVIFRLVRQMASLPEGIKWLAIGILLFFLGQVLISGFYNSGFYGKAPNAVFWICFGSVVALMRQNSRVSTQRKSENAA